MESQTSQDNIKNDDLVQFTPNQLIIPILSSFQEQLELKTLEEEGDHFLRLYKNALTNKTEQLNGKRKESLALLQNKFEELNKKRKAFLEERENADLDMAAMVCAADLSFEEKETFFNNDIKELMATMNSQQKSIKCKLENDLSKLSYQYHKVMAEITTLKCENAKLRAHNSEQSRQSNEFNVEYFKNEIQYYEDKIQEVQEDLRITREKINKFKN